MVGHHIIESAIDSALFDMYWLCSIDVDWMASHHIPKSAVDLALFDMDRLRVSYLYIGW